MTLKPLLALRDLGTSAWEAAPMRNFPFYQTKSLDFVLVNWYKVRVPQQQTGA
jgi:hypothetical protein